MIIKSWQNEAFGKEIQCIQNNRNITKSSVLSKLSPIIDPQGLLCVGGRLEQGELTNEEKHPVILPGQHHVTTLVVEHLHHEIKHQGRHFTQGIVRAKGYLIIGGKRLINRVIYRCFKVSKTEREVAKSEDGQPTDRTITTSPSVHLRRFRCLRTVASYNSQNSGRSRSE